MSVGPQPPQSDDLSDELELSIQGVASRERQNGVLDLEIKTTRGDLKGVLHACEGESGAAIFVGGALGGTHGPAGSIYERLGISLAASVAPSGLTSLRLGYREPGEFQECVLDVLAGVSLLKGLGARKVALVGHSFGGGVVIKAGELSELVTGIAALSPQLYGTRTVARLAPKPLLLVHGTADSILDCAASSDIYDRALEPKRIVLYEGAGHGLSECADELFELLSAWLIEVTAEPE